MKIISKLLFVFILFLIFSSVDAYILDSDWREKNENNEWVKLDNSFTKIIED
jgi:hypothetical protein